MQTIGVRCVHSAFGGSYPHVEGRPLQTGPWKLLLTIVFMSCGCGDNAASSSQQTDVSSDTVADVASSSSENLFDTVPQKAHNQSSVAIGENPDATAGTGSKGTSATNAIPLSQSTQVSNVTTNETPPTPPAPKPTQEQIARWTPAPWEALQLMACRDSIETGMVKALAALSDGRHYLLAGSSVTLWSIDETKPEYVFAGVSGDNTIESLAIAPDEKWFAVGDSEGQLRVWNLADRTELQSKKLYSTAIIQTAISPDSQTIATLTYDNEITIWNAVDLRQLQRFSSDTNGIKRIEYMTSELLAVAGETTSLWNVGTGKLDKQLSPGRYNFALARTADGSRFLFGQEDALEVWKVSEQKTEVILHGSFAQEELTTFSNNGSLVATANQSMIRIWDVATGKPMQFIDAVGWPVTGMVWLPETDVLLVTSITGRRRIWTTPKNGGDIGMKPMHVGVIAVDPTRHVPATPVQLMQAIDLRTFPRLPEGKIIANDQFILMYEVVVSADEAQLFYRYFLNQAGWKEDAAEGASPGSLRFRKDGIALSLSCYAEASGKTMVSLNVAGSYDLRWLPKSEDASNEIVFENADTVIYRTKTGITAIEVELLRKMHDAGWTAYSRLNSAHTEDADRRDLNFLRNGLTVGISISLFPSDPAILNVQYTQSLTARSIPVPQDSGYVEFDGSAKPLLVASTSLSLAQTCEFYDNELAADGWLPRDLGRSIKEDNASLPFIRGQQDLIIHLNSMKSGRTQIIVGDDLQNSSWQLSKPKDAATADNAAAGMEAADFPILNESKIAKYDAQGMSIDISMNATPLVEVANLYETEMKSLGWDTEGAGIRSDDYVFLTFVKDKEEIQLRARMTGGMSTVNIQGDGLMWSKELPGAKKILSFETWLQTNHHPATLELLDEYQKEMESIINSTPTSAEKE